MSGDNCTVIIMSREIMAKAHSFIELNKCLKKEDLKGIIGIMEKFQTDADMYLQRALSSDCKHE